MERKKLRAWSSLVLVTVVAGAFWLWRSRTTEESARPLPSTAASASAPVNPARAQPMQPPAMRRTEAPEIETPSPQPISRRPTVTLPELSSVEIQALGEHALIGPHAWNRHIAPLLYPPGHPDEGTYLDSVTLDQAVEAQLRFQEEIIFGGEEYLNKPQLHIQKHFNYKDLNERRRAWDSTDLRSTREFYDWMVAQPEDPGGRWGDIWLDADPADRDAITRRELLAEEIRAREAPIFAGETR